IACYEEALRLAPQHVEAHSNLANAWKDQGRLAAALAGYQTALWLKPDDPSTHWNRALALLQGGNFEEGWPEYEWRWRRKRDRVWPFPGPMWDGSPLAGRTILLWGEQGLGDSIQFVRYAPLVAQAAARVLLICPSPLVRLLATSEGVEKAVHRVEDLPPFDAHV